MAGKGKAGPGRPKGLANKATKERLERERVAQQAQAEVDKARAENRKLGKDVLEEFMITFATMAKAVAPYPRGVKAPVGHKADEAKFLTYAKLTVDTARDLAAFQSPKFKAIAIMAPPPNPVAIERPGNVKELDNDPLRLARVYSQMVKQVR